MKMKYIIIIILGAMLLHYPLPSAHSPSTNNTFLKIQLDGLSALS